MAASKFPSLSWKLLDNGNFKSPWGWSFRLGDNPTSLLRRNRFESKFFYMNIFQESPLTKYRNSLCSFLWKNPKGAFLFWCLYEKLYDVTNCVFWNFSIGFEVIVENYTMEAFPHDFSQYYLTRKSRIDYNS